MKNRLIPLTLVAALVAATPCLAASPDHARLLTRDFTSTMTYDIVSSDSSQKLPMKISFSLLCALTQGGSVVGWDYTVTAQMPKGLSDSDRVISLFSIGAQGYRHNLTVIDADPAVEFHLPRLPSWVAGTGPNRQLLIEGTMPFTLGGPGVNSSSAENVAYVRNLQSGTYSFVLRLKQERPMHGSYTASPDTPSLDLGPSSFSLVAARSPVGEVPPPVPPGGSDEP